MTIDGRRVIAAGIMLATCGVAFGAPRDVQFASVDLSTGVIELKNLGPDTEDLSGWRFCTHDESVVRRYTTSTGLNGISLAPGESLFIHTLNDAAGPGQINVATLGNFALPIDGDDATDAYGMQIYFSPVSFGNGNTIADHVQWSFGGANNLTADDRTDEAVAGGVWNALDSWVATDASTTVIHLKDKCGNEAHSPEDYQVLPTVGADRDVQIRSVDFETGVVELFNFGAVPIDLSGWRWCTHDEDEILRYTASGGFNGVTIPACGSVFIHTLNDASGPGEINVALLGGTFALPLDADDYGMQIYFPPVNFGNGNTIADHLQWATDGTSTSNSNTRSDEAVNGGVWSGIDDYIATDADTDRIDLAGQCGRELHSPADYVVSGVPTPDPCSGDVDGDGDTDVFDFADLAANFGAGPGATREQGDLTGDGFVDVFDFGDLAADFGCTP